MIKMYRYSMLATLVLGFVLNTKYVLSADCLIHGKPDYKEADCRNRGLMSVPQHLDSTIRSIDLSSNQLTAIGRYEFIKYRYLEKIIIDHNDLHSLDSEAFGGLPGLHSLSMFSNDLNISEGYPSGIFDSIMSLTYLNIGRNMKTPSFDEVIYALPIDKLTSLRFLTVDLVKKPIFRQNLKGLVSLKFLRFDYCRIGYLGNTTFENLSSSVKELHMSNCKDFFQVEIDALHHFPTLSILNLIYTNVHLVQALRLLYPFQNKTMEKLLLRHVTFAFSEKFDNDVVLTNEMMQYISTICIKTLDISNNKIVSVKDKSILSFKFPECFENLYLSANRFEIDEFAVDFFTYLWSMSNLKVFDLSYIPIQFKKPLYINCEIYNRNGSMFGRHCYEHEYDTELKSSISTVTLPSNLIYVRTTHILAKQLIDKIKLTNSSLRYFDMSYYMAGKFPKFIVEGYNNLTVLNISGIDADMTLPKLPLLQNLKELKMEYTKLNTVIRTNESIFAWAPNIESLDISFNNIWRIKENSFGSLYSLKYVNLSHNMLQLAPEMLFQYEYLVELDLSFNLMTMIQASVRDWIDGQQERFGNFHLYLQKNAFICTCDSTNFLRWVELPITKATLDKDQNYTCLYSGKHDTMKDVFEHFHKNFAKCNSTLWLQIGISLLASVLCVIVLITIVYNLRWKMVFFFHRKFRRLVEKGLEVDFKYDVYVSYSDDSASFVKRVLLPKIERHWGLTMCCEDRDFEIGHSAADVRAMSIHQSRHIIFIVTPSFSKNQWCSFEIERAKYEKFSKDLQRIIVVIKDMPFDNIPFEFSSVWKDVCLIEWPNDVEDLDLTWQKFRLWLF